MVPVEMVLFSLIVFFLSITTCKLFWSKVVGLVFRLITFGGVFSGPDEIFLRMRTLVLL